MPQGHDAGRRGDATDDRDHRCPGCAPEANARSELQRSRDELAVLAEQQAALRRVATLVARARDDGSRGADFDKGSGLIGLKDRVEALSGHLALSSTIENGTSITATIPLRGR